MKTTIFAHFKVFGVILLAIAIGLLLLAMVHGAQTLIASVSWNG